jgi:hypothetical protein
LRLHQVFFFDGKDFTLRNPYENVYATEPIPGPIENMFNIARDTFGLSAPIADLVYRNAFLLLTHGLNGGVVIGKEMIGAVQCDHLLFSNSDAHSRFGLPTRPPFAIQMCGNG